MSVYQADPTTQSIPFSIPPYLTMPSMVVLFDHVGFHHSKGDLIMTVAVYARVSTEGQNLAGQKREIMRWLEGNGINLKQVQWYVDKESGTTLDRPEFQQLQKDIFNGAIKTVVVYKLDRLSRSMKDGHNLLCDWCERGIRVVATSQQIDFSGVVGKMIAVILLAVAEMEKENILERQAAGIAAAKERGVYTGRKLGAVKAGVDPDRAMELREKGLTNSEIAKSLGVSVSSVIRYTKRADQLTASQ